jgi:hypothetical protein
MALTSSDPAPDLLEQAWESLETNGSFDLDTEREIVAEQLRQNRDLLDAHLAQIPRSDLRAELLLAEAALLIASDPKGARRALEDALVESERSPRGTPKQSVFTIDGAPYRVPASEGLALAVATTIVRRDQRVAAALVDAAANPDIRVHWRLDVLGEMLERGESAAAEWWLATLATWATETSNPNFRYKLPVLVGRLPDVLFEQTVAKTSDVRDGVKRAWLMAAASARIAVRDRMAANAMLEEAFAACASSFEPGDPTAKLDLAAFAAGQWQAVDADISEQCWRDAMRHITELNRPKDNQDYLVGRAIEYRGYGSPSTAIEKLRATPAEPIADGVVMLRVPGAGVPVMKASGMTNRDYMLGTLIGDQAARSGASVQETFNGIDTQDARALAAVRAARKSTGAPLKKRMDWCAAAERAARAISEHHISCLMLAECALAYRDLGATRKAMALASETATDVLTNGTAFGAVHRKSAYGYAFGVCVGLLGTDETQRDDALRLVWEGRRLDGAFDDMLAAMTPIIGASNAQELERVVDAERDALALCES